MRVHAYIYATDLYFQYFLLSLNIAIERANSTSLALPSKENS